MSPTLKASKPGLAKIQQARNEKGWTIEDDRWLLEASLILEPEKDWQLGNDCYANGCSESTWKRFLRGTAIGSAAFQAFCQVLGLDWQEVVARTTIEQTNSNAATFTNRRLDCDKAPDSALFYGRESELATLEQWIVDDGCRLVALWGMAGIGKTALAVKLAKQIADRFEYVIWRSLSLSPTMEATLTDLLGFLSHQPQTKADLDKLIDYLRSHRCLLILDGAETILGTGQLAGKYRDGYQDYSRFFRQIGELQHQSCLLLTSSEKIRNIALMEGKNSPIRAFKLLGLSKEDAREILREKGLLQEEKWKTIIERYTGHPLALKIVANTILELFDGKPSQFINQNTTFLGPIHDLLEQQFERLSDLEIGIVGQLAMTDKPLSIQQLKASISSAISTSQIMASLESLAWRCLIEKIADTDEPVFTLQSVIRKYVINEFCQNAGG